MNNTKAMNLPNMASGNGVPARNTGNVPKGLNVHHIHLAANAMRSDQIMVYHNPTRIILQMRRQINSEENILQPSYQVACELTPAEALALASTLLAVATPRIHSVLSQSTQSFSGEEPS